METPFAAPPVHARIVEALERIATALRADDWVRARSAGVNPTQLAILRLLDGRGPGWTGAGPPRPGDGPDPGPSAGPGNVGPPPAAGAGRTPGHPRCCRDPARRGPAGGARRSAGAGGSPAGRPGRSSGGARARGPPAGRGPGAGPPAGPPRPGWPPGWGFWTSPR